MLDDDPIAIKSSFASSTPLSAPSHRKSHPRRRRQLCRPQAAHVLKWLADHPRWMFPFTPTSASWLNAVEGFFSAITRRQIRREPSIHRRSAERDQPLLRQPQRRLSTVRMTASAKAIFKKLAHIPVPSV
jgi:hypothetical protein